MNFEKQRPLWDLTQGQRIRYVAAIGAMGLSNVFLFGVPLVAKSALDAVAEGGAFSPWRSAAAIVACTAAAGVLQFLRGRWAAMASEAIVCRIRDRLFAHLERLPCAYHDRADTGDLVQRCTSDVETIRVFLSGQVVEIGRASLLFLMALPVLLSLHVPLTLVAIALFPLIIGFAVAFFRRIQTMFLASDEAEGAMTAVLQENLTGIRVVRAFARQDFECDKFAERNARFRDRTYDLIRLLGRYWAISDFVCVGQILLVLIFGTQWMIAGSISVGTLFAFLMFINFVIWPVRHLGRVLSDTGKAIVALGRLGEILDVPEEEEAIEPSDRPEKLHGAIDVRDLTFSYDGSGPALQDVRFSVSSGETLALVGPPGSGKSTLIQLLLRLYDYESGSIRLDGRELRTLPRGFVREHFGVVLQEPFLYSKTLIANVKVGRETARFDEVIESTEDAGIHATIESFDRGYETLVGERGVTLSGGQRQRVALARALVKDPDVLVLDDALSAVDVEMEARILDALQRRRGRHTTILIAHRLSTIVQADRILVFEHGEIVQSGTHEELAKAEGPYRRLWRIQGSLESEIRDDLEPSREEATS